MPQTDTPAARNKSIRDTLRHLYESASPRAMRMRWAMLEIDALLVAFFLVTTFVEHGQWLITADYVIGSILLIEWMVRLWISRDRIGLLTQPMGVLDIAVILSLFAPSITENFVFLRILRALRLLRSYHVLRELRKRYRFFTQHEQVIFAGTNLIVFIFIVSAAVYALQYRVNEQITDYVDALYFTITTLTTTGFGDIVMVGSGGRLLAAVIMIVGVSLFLRLIQAIFRPSKVDYECPDCGLARHDPDAIHCKHCGRLLHIFNTGDAS
ncbi:MAG: potassium channel family protein [Nevskiales bacterium]|nr:potassium channel family protein [Nevskiales bacterium]